jgi:hypothetical protein
VIGTIPRGEKVLVTGRSADGGWLQVFYPGPAFDRAWTRAGPLRLEADASGLRIAACEAAPTPSPRPTPEASTAVVSSPEASPSPEPSPSAAPSPSPSPSPAPSAKPTPTPTPTPRPTPNAVPSITGLTTTTKTLSYDQGAYCPTAPKSVTFTLKASDAGGIATATLFWRKPGAPSYVAAPMTLAGGSAQNGTWRATLDTKANAITTAGRLTYYVAVRDSDGAQTRSPATGTQVITVTVCVNTGPTFTSGPSAGDSTLYADPRNVGCGSPIGTEIRATIADIDGVKSATLVFTDQAGTIVERPMAGFAGDLWTSSINANDDGTQAGGTFTWHVVAVDGKDAQTTSDPQSIRVIRCDTPGRVGASLSSPPLNADGINSWGRCPSPVSVVFSITAFDPDSPNGPLQVQVAWSMSDSDGVRQETGMIDAAQLKGSAYTAAIPLSVTSSWCDTFVGSANNLTYTITAIDQFGGVTRRSFKATLDIFSPLY